MIINASVYRYIFIGFVFGIGFGGTICIAEQFGTWIRFAAGIVVGCMCSATAWLVMRKRK